MTIHDISLAIRADSPTKYAVYDIVNSDRTDKGGAPMTFQCCCYCQENMLPVIREGMEHFTAQTGVRIQAEWFGSQNELYRRLVSKEKCGAVLIALPGAAGMEAATHTRELLPSIPLIWCSDDRDFAIHSYRLRAASFLKMPVTPEQIRDSLKICRERYDV